MVLQSGPISRVRSGLGAEDVDELRGHVAHLGQGPGETGQLLRTWEASVRGSVRVCEGVCVCTSVHVGGRGGREGPRVQMFEGVPMGI